MSLKEHEPVLLDEVLEGLQIQPNGIYIDATFGRGGHSLAILERLGPKGRLLVMDRDPEAIQTAERIQSKDARLILKHGAFSNLYAFCEQEGVVGKVSGILFDLGVSSPQLDQEDRGFSFKADGPLDMRMDPSTGYSAAEWINSAEETEIAQILRVYGEERFSKRIARAIIAARSLAPITRTLALANIVAKANPAWEKFKHPATRSFQAIRIKVNNELEEIQEGLEAALGILSVEGRLAVISFHSLEDRLVKRFIQKNEKGDEYPKGLPIQADALNQTLRRVGSSIKPSLEEVKRNSRARSATLRLAKKIGNRI